jgi:taurine dioxygenase
MTSNSIIIEPSGGGVGAFVSGADLADLRAPDIALLREALGAHGVLFFREQSLSPEKHEQLAESFGPINVNRFFSHVEGYPRIAEVRKEPDQTANIGGGWHTDHSYDEIPALGSILVARELPEHGGDTLFANMYAAYQSLSDGLKATLETLNGVHSSRHVFGEQSRYRRNGSDVAGRIGNPELATQDAVHPLVITHPISGQKSLYVNPGFTIGIEGWTSEESEPLLQYLYQQAIRPEHTYRFQWSEGAVAFWDNRATWHYAVNDYHGTRRLLHRITIDGERLAA